MTDDHRDSTPAVSVVVPTFQRRELVRRAVASVLAQSFRDLELIVVDDGSTDGTGELLQGASDARLRYVWQENAGVAAARNRALAQARAPLAAFLDSDNWWLPDHLAVATAMMARHPEAVMGTTCPRFQIGGRQGPQDAELRDYRDRILTCGATAGYITCVVVRREALKRVGGFDERIRGGEDSDLWVRLGTLGPIASTRRRTVVRQATAGSLVERSRRAGDYLAGAEWSAANLLAAAEAAPAAQRARLRDQGRSALAMARAMSALDRGAPSAEVAAELKGAAGLLPDAQLPQIVEHRVFAHLTRTHDPAARLAAFRTLGELWPDQRSTTARYLRAYAIAYALRLGRLSDLAPLVARWQWPGTVAFARRAAPLLYERARRVLQERRQREP